MQIRPVIVPTYILLSSNTGEDTLGPISVTHKSEGLRGILDAETPVRIELPRNIFHECVSDIANDWLPLNSLIENIHLLKNIFPLIATETIWNHRKNICASGTIF
jgi:hypothetical protein